jgi:hypothetical protein
MKIFIWRNQKQEPVSLEQINAELAGGTLKLSDLAWIEGWKTWQPVSAVPGVRVPMQPPPLPESVRTQVAGGSEDRRPTIVFAAAVVALLVVTAAPVLSIIVAAVALYFAHRIRKVANQSASFSGRGLTTWALVLGYLVIPLSVAVMLIGLNAETQDQKHEMATDASAPISNSPTANANPVATLDYTFDYVGGYGSFVDEMKRRDEKIRNYSSKVARDVYKIASTRPEVTKVIIRINCRFQPETVEDYYGHEHTRPAETAFAQEVTVDDLAEVRRYTESSYTEHEPFFSTISSALNDAQRQSAWNPPMPE